MQFLCYRRRLCRSDALQDRNELARLHLSTSVLMPAIADLFCFASSASCTEDCTRNLAAAHRNKHACSRHPELLQRCRRPIANLSRTPLIIRSVIHCSKQACPAKPNRNGKLNKHELLQGLSPCGRSCCTVASYRADHGSSRKRSLGSSLDKSPKRGFWPQLMLRLRGLTC